MIGGDNIQSESTELPVEYFEEEGAPVEPSKVEAILKKLRKIKDAKLTDEELDVLTDEFSDNYPGLTNEDMMEYSKYSVMPDREIVNSMNKDMALIFSAIIKGGRIIYINAIRRIAFALKRKLVQDEETDKKKKPEAPTLTLKMDVPKASPKKAESKAAPPEEPKTVTPEVKAPTIGVATPSQVAASVTKEFEKNSSDDDKKSKNLFSSSLIPVTSQKVTVHKTNVFGIAFKDQEAHYLLRGLSPISSTGPQVAAARNKILSNYNKYDEDSRAQIIREIILNYKFQSPTATMDEFKAMLAKTPGNFNFENTHNYQRKIKNFTNRLTVLSALLEGVDANFISWSNITIPLRSEINVFLKGIIEGRYIDKKLLYSKMLFSNINLTVAMNYFITAIRNIASFINASWKPGSVLNITPEMSVTESTFTPLLLERRLNDEQEGVIMGLVLPKIQNIFSCLDTINVKNYNKEQTSKIVTPVIALALFAHTRYGMTKALKIENHNDIINEYELRARIVRRNVRSMQNLYMNLEKSSSSIRVFSRNVDKTFDYTAIETELTGKAPELIPH